MGLGNQIEGLATLARPTVQIANLNVANAQQSAIFGPGTPGQIARLRIINLSASLPVAITLTPIETTSNWQAGGTSTSSTSTTPSYATANITCSALNPTSFAVATDGIRIQPGTTLELNISTATRVALIASSATVVPVQIACFLQNG